MRDKIVYSFLAERKREGLVSGGHGGAVDGE